MKNLFFLVVVLLLSGCSRFKTYDSPFETWNMSSNQIVTLVDGPGEVGPVINAQGHAAYEVKISIPRREGVSDLDDETTQVQVAVRNLTTGLLTEPQGCQAGPKIITSIIYYPPDEWNPRGRVECRWSW